jgi:hypothetical protein
MIRFFAAVTLATVIASPAVAQSFDPSVGSGNIAPQQYNDTSGSTVVPYTLQERRALERAKENPR